MAVNTQLQTKGQVTLPKEARDEMGVAPGDTLTWVRNEEGHWEIWKFEDLLDELSDTLEDLDAWSRKVKKGYRTKREAR